MLAAMKYLRSLDALDGILPISSEQYIFKECQLYQTANSVNFYRNIGSELMVEKENKLECTDCGDPGIGLETPCKLWIKDRFVDAMGVDDIMEEVFRMRLKDRDRIAEELMSRFLIVNQMNEGQEKDYRVALIDEYERRQEPYI